MKHKFQNQTEYILEKDDLFYFQFDQFDKEISLAFHSSRNDVTDYTMSVEKFLKSLQQSIEDFDETELEVMKTTAAVLFGQIKKIESKTEKEVTI